MKYQHAQAVHPHSVSRRSLLAVAAASLGGASMLPAFASDAVTIEVPFSAGSGNDLVARILSRKLPEFIGEAVIVDNRAGASGTIATEYTRRAAPDGKTLVLASAAFSVNPFTTHIKYTVSDFTPIAQVGSLPFILLVSKSVTAKNVKELVEAVKANPDRFSGGQGDVNGTNFILMKQLSKAAGTDIVSASYRGTPDALVDLQADRIQMMFAPVSTGLQQHGAGGVRILGISGAKRTAAMPDVPTFMEQGFPKLDLSTWFGVLGPAGMPRPAVNTLSAAIEKTLDAKETVDALTRLGITPSYAPAAQFKTFLQADSRMWHLLLRESGISK